MDMQGSGFPPVILITRLTTLPVQWDPKYRIKVRVICARAYHALFMVCHITECRGSPLIIFLLAQHAHPTNGSSTRRVRRA